MQIRDERPDDVSRISQIHYAAFKGHPMHPPGAEPVEHRIVERLRAADALSLSLVAAIDGEPAGHVALSPAAVGAVSHGWYLLGPLGVLPRLQRRGIGSALMREALSRQRVSGAAGIVLVGDPAFYSRFGFGNVPGLTCRGVPEEYARCILAVCFGDTLPAGAIVGHEAFDMPGGERLEGPSCSLNSVGDGK